MNAVTLSHAKQNLEKLVEQVLANAEPTIVSTDTGQSVVLLPLDEFNAWQETFYLLRHPANAEHLRKSIAEAQSSSLTDWDRVDAMTDDMIDTSDSPPLTKEFFATATWRIPPPSVTVSVQVEPEILKWYEAQGEDYARLLTAALRIYAEAHREPVN